MKLFIVRCIKKIRIREEGAGGLSVMCNEKLSGNFISTAMTLIVFAIFETAKQAKAILMIFCVTQQGQNKLVRGELIVALED